MIKTVFNKIDALGPYLYLLGPYIFFVGYFNGVKFVSFSAVVSLLGVVTIALIAARRISINNFTINSHDLIILVLNAYFLATVFISDYIFLSFKRWALTIFIGTSFYLVGRLLLNPSMYLRKTDLFCSICILVLLSFTIFMYIFGQSHHEPGLQWSDLIPLPNDTFIGQTYAGRSIGDFFFLRPSSLFPNPNGIALFAMLAFAISWLDWDKRSIWRWLLLLAIVILLLWTASRAALLGTAIFLLSYQFCTSSRLRRLTPIIIGTVIILPLSIYIYTLISPQAEQWNNYFEILELRERGSGWKVALNNFPPDLWLIGVGFGIVQEAVLGPNDFIFSIWIVLLLETGIIGVSLVLLLWTLSLKKCFSSLGKSREGSQAQKVNAVIFSLLLALLFHQAFDLSAFRFHPLNFFLFSLFGLAANPKLTTVEPSE